MQRQLLNFCLDLDKSIFPSVETSLPDKEFSVERICLFENIFTFHLIKAEMVGILFVCVLFGFPCLFGFFKYHLIKKKMLSVHAGQQEY